jgi:hypothetical protein
MCYLGGHVSPELDGPVALLDAARRWVFATPAAPFAVHAVEIVDGGPRQVHEPKGAHRSTTSVTMAGLQQWRLATCAGCRAKMRDFPNASGTIWHVRCLVTV